MHPRSTRRGPLLLALCPGAMVLAVDVLTIGTPIPPLGADLNTAAREIPWLLAALDDTAWARAAHEAAGVLLSSPSAVGAASVLAAAVLAALLLPALLLPARRTAPGPRPGLGAGAGAGVGVGAGTVPDTEELVGAPR
ncbi:hypothetical protein ACWEQL_01710 [Kitasatospora sp. NPDC004240]